MNKIHAILGRSLLLLTMLVLIAPAGFTKNIELTSTWKAQAMKISGQLSDWPEGTTTFLEGNESTFGICNDSQRIYIMLSFRKSEWARLVRRGGLTVWLDPKGKKDKDFMLRFVGGPTMEQIMAVSGPGRDSLQRQVPPEMQERMREAESNFENKLICFQKDYLVEKPIPLDGTQGPAVAYGVDKGFFVYEFSIPLAKSVPMYYGLGVPSEKPIGVGLIWGEFDRDQMREGMGGRDEGVHIGGMGGGFPGERGGERAGFPDRPRMGEPPQKQEVWLKVKLSSPDAVSSPAPK